MTHAMRVLEFPRIIQMLAGHCESEPGRGLAESLSPAFERTDVERLLVLTAEACALIDQHPVPSLAPIRQHGQSLELASKGGVLEGESLAAIAGALAAMRQLRDLLGPKRELLPHLSEISSAIADHTRIERALENALDGSMIRDSASPELARLRQRAHSASAKMLERIQRHISGKSRELLSDPIYTQRDGRYVVPLKSEHRGKIKGIIHDTSASGSTLFVEPEDVLEAANAAREAEAAALAEERRILAQLSGLVGSVSVEIAAGLSAATQLDLALAKARYGYATKGCVPELLKIDAAIDINTGRHPLLERESAVPLSLRLGLECEGLLITGPNTGGKTVAIKTVGLFVLMAQSGLMPPAASVRLGPFSQVWADIGDEQSIQQSLSTFSAHVQNVADALRGLRDGALVLLDEVGAGTDPSEGAALAKAILVELRAAGARVLASSHYGELKIFAYNEPGFMNAAMEFDVKTLRPTYRMMMGAPGASHALKIAERCGLPKPVVDAARNEIGVEERDVALMLEKLETAQKLAQRAQGDADRMAAELKSIREAADRKLAEADEIRRTAKQRAAEALEDTLRGLRNEAAEIFDRLKSSGTSSAKEEARRQLSALQEAGSSLAKEMAPKPESFPATSLDKGSPVRVHGYTQVGTVIEPPKDGQVLVQLGIMKVKVALDRVAAAEVSNPATVKRAGQNLGLQRAQSMSSEIHLRRLRAEDAEQELAKFVDDAILAGLSSIRIVHGKGDGVLREVTRRLLKSHKGVRTFRIAEPSEGGEGVTVAYLE